MRRAIGIGLLLAGLVVPRPAEANILCRWFGYCVYESPGFRITLVDRETGRPLADVHALAIWVMRGSHGADGPIMVQDAVSGPDGVVALPHWGPIRGSTAGLEVGYDPVLSLFLPGYKVYHTNNRGGPRDGRARVHGFGQDGQTFFLEPFRGTPEDWAGELREAAYPKKPGSTSEEQLLQFRTPYLNRRQRVWAELLKLPQEKKQVRDLAWSLQESLQFLQEGRR